jgi:uncharacterized protein (DUF58 family)
MKPTRRLIAYGAVTGVSLLPAVFVEGMYGWLPALFLLCALLLSMGYMFLLRRGLRCHVSVDLQTCRRGEEAQFAVDLFNESRLVLSKGIAEIYTNDDTGNDLTSINAVFSMGKERSQRIAFQVRFAHIGVYHAGIRRFELFDPMGLFHVSLPVAENSFPVSVLPHVVEINSMHFANENRAETMRSPKRSIEGEGMDYSGVRDYVAGDPIKQIHWKLSAHMGDYMTKIMEMQTNTGISIILDTTSSPYTGEEVLTVYDAIIESGLSAARYAARRGLDCDLTYTDRLGRHRRMIPDKENAAARIVGDLPQLHTNADSRDGVELVTQNSRFTYGQSNLIICTGRLDRELVQSIVQAKKRGRVPFVIAAVPPGTDLKDRSQRGLADARRVLRMAQIPCMIISDVSELV